MGQVSATQSVLRGRADALPNHLPVLGRERVACLRHSVWISERASERADEIVCITYIYIRFVGVAFITSAPPVFPVLRATGQSVDMVLCPCWARALERQRYATVCYAYRPTFIRCLSIKIT